MRTFSPVSFNERTTEIDAKLEVGDISELDIRYNFDIEDGVIGEPYLHIPLNITRSLFSQLQERCTVLQEAGYEDYEDWNQSNNGSEIWLLVRKNLDMSIELQVYPHHYWDERKSNSREPAKIFMQRIWLFDREKQDLCQMLRDYLEENGTSLEEKIENNLSEKNMERVKEKATTFKLFRPKAITLDDDTWGNMNVFEKEYKYEKNGNREKITFPVTFFYASHALYLLDKTDMYKALGYKNARQMLEGIRTYWSNLEDFYEYCSNGDECKEYIQRREKWVEEGKFQNDALLKAYLTFYYENGEPTDAYMEFAFDYQQISLRDSVKLSEKEAKDLEDALRDRFCIWAYGYIPVLCQDIYDDRYPILEFIKVKEQTGKLPTQHELTDEERKQWDESLKKLPKLRAIWEK